MIYLLTIESPYWYAADFFYIQEEDCFLAKSTHYDDYKIFVRGNSVSIEKDIVIFNIYIPMCQTKNIIQLIDETIREIIVHLQNRLNELIFDKL